MVKKHLSRLRGQLSEDWRKNTLVGVGAVLFIVAVVQCVYPWNNLPLYATVDGVDVGGKSIQDATKLLNKRYANLPVELYFGDGERPYTEPKPSDIGIEIDAKKQAEAERYRWWLRLVPTSLWWAGLVGGDTKPAYTHDEQVAKKYIEAELGKDCEVTPKNATIEYKDEVLRVVPALDGGSCDFDQVVKLLMEAKPTLNNAKLRIKIDSKPAKVTDKMAGEFMAKISARTATGLSLGVGEESVVVSHDALLGWLDFTTDNDTIRVKVDTKKAKDFLGQKVTPKLKEKAGTTYVTTMDFAEISRTDGKPGQTLDLAGTLDNIEQWLMGNQDEVDAKIKTIAPNIVYTRKYSKTDTGLAALLKHFAESNKGVFGVSMAELSGARRHAGYNDTRVFETASTYKLYVAYGTLKKIEAGKWKWTDKNIHNGRNLAKCFDDMIVLSDNECSHALLDKIGYQSLTDQIHAIGLTNSSFLHSYIETTPGDLAKFLGMLESGQILNSSSRNTLISAMKRQVYRGGVPSGTSATVADKVGFLQGHITGVSGTIYLLHDAAIVYSPKGTYVLAVMTGGSSWAKIAELTSKIENWR